jgi:hypothetical protein
MMIALANVQKPTGDPTIPKDVLRAKRIQREIESRAGIQEMCDGVDDEEIPPGFNNDDVGSQLSHDAFC